MGLGQKKRIKERDGGKEGDLLWRYCYAAKMTNWTDCL
jgi:hypothetical protein